MGTFESCVTSFKTGSNLSCMHSDPIIETPHLFLLPSDSGTAKGPV